MATNRWDETWHRLLEWTNGQGPSERLAAQVLQHEGFRSLDPSHPLGGKDGGKDAICKKDNKRWAMAVYFPRGQQSFADIAKKFDDDLNGAKSNQAQGFAFVTNQELRLAERKTLTDKWAGCVDLLHLERLTAILDTPAMATVRKQFLGIDYEESSVRGISQVGNENVVVAGNAAPTVVGNGNPQVVSTVTSTNQSGGITAGNIGSITLASEMRRIVDDQLKAWLGQTFPSGEPVQMFTPMFASDPETVQFATSIKQYLLSTGHNVALGSHSELFQDVRADTAASPKILFVGPRSTT